MSEVKGSAATSAPPRFRGLPLALAGRSSEARGQGLPGGTEGGDSVVPASAVGRDLHVTDSDRS